MWDAGTGQPLTDPIQHKGSIRSAEFSSDGQRIVTASFDLTARVWDAQTGAPLSEPLRHKSNVLSATFSPDGEWVLTASMDGMAWLWDVRLGKALTEPLQHKDWVNSASFSSDGDLVVTASNDKGARVWDARTCRPSTESLMHSDWVLFAQFSPDGQRVLTTAREGTVRIWDSHTGQPVTSPLKAPSDARRSVTTGTWPGPAQFSPDGQRVVAASNDKTAWVFDAQTGQPVTGPLTHTGSVVFTQFSPDGQRVVTASLDKTARVWDARTGRPVSEPLKHNDYLTTARFSPDGQRVVTASQDNTAQVWEIKSSQRVFEPLRHRGWVGDARFSEDGRYIATASNDGTARVWNARTGQPISPPLSHNGWVHSARFSPDSRRVVTASFDGTARVWDATTGEPVAEPLRHNSTVSTATFSPDGQRLVTTSSDNTARIWDLPLSPFSTPKWLLELAETIGGVTPNQGVGGSDASDELTTVKRHLEEALADAPYVRWGRWFFADRATRTVSPGSTITVPEYVQRRINENMLQSLSESVLLSPNNALALARLGRVRSAADPAREPGVPGQAELLTRRAVELSPRDPECWLIRGMLLQQNGSTNEALKALSRVVDLAGGETNEMGRVFSQALLTRGNLLKRLNRFAEAQADFLRAKGIAPRVSPTTPDAIDLSSYYNFSLAERWHASPEGSDLSELPQGVQNLDGIKFDIRGAIQVGFRAITGEPYPKEVSGIAVHRRCQRLHFLHSAINAIGTPYGTEIGHYRIHYADGGETRIPLVIGRHLGDWYEQPRESGAQWQVAWTGANKSSRALNRKIRLFKTTWQNPQLETVVETIDIVSTQDDVAPFVVAVTTEP